MEEGDLGDDDSDSLVVERGRVLRGVSLRL